MARVSRRAAAVLAVAVAVLSACAPGSQPAGSASPTGGPSPTSAAPPVESPSPAPSPATALGLDDCVPRTWRTVRLRTRDGIRLAAAETGRGRRGVVFAHESDGTLCNWVPYATALARRGVRVLVVDLRGHGSSAAAPASRTLAWTLDVIAAAQRLRRGGVRRVALVGASAGGTAALVAAGDLPGVAAVASLSGPAGFGPLDAAQAVRTLRISVLYLVGALDRGFVPDARRLAMSTRGPHQLLVVPDNGWHGTALLDDPERGPALSALLTRFLLGALPR